MANPGEFQKVAAGDDFVVAEDVDVVLVNDTDVVRGRRSALAILPLLLGVLILALDAYLLFRLPTTFFAKNLQGGISLALVFASGIIGLFLIAYAFGLSRFEHRALEGRNVSPYVTWVVVPLLLGALALAATVGGMEWNRAASERQPQKPCIDLIEQAQNIAKDNPLFRMPAKDANEVRCGINAAIGR